ncbi:MAG: ABC transporter ATP-binding protein, partial [Pseudomonadota bacterium]
MIANYDPLSNYHDCHSMFARLFQFFETRIDPFPPDELGAVPAGIFAFCWRFTKPVSGWLVLLIILNMAVAVGEVLLFSFMGEIVNWFSQIAPEQIWDEYGWQLAGIALLVLLILPLCDFLSACVSHQTLVGNFPMTIRWYIHRHLLKQSVQFFADDFAGRIAAKLMQSALAVRDVATKICNVFVFIVTYFIAMLALLGSASLWLMTPVLCWVVIYIGLLAYYLPRLTKTSKWQANMRAAMTGRVVDSFSNISTVKLF